MRVKSLLFCRKSLDKGNSKRGDPYDALQLKVTSPMILRLSFVVTTLGLSVLHPQLKADVTFKSLEAARDHVRTLPKNQPITVKIAAGHYGIEQPILFGPGG